MLELEVARCHERVGLYLILGDGRVVNLIVLVDDHQSKLADEIFAELRSEFVGFRTIPESHLGGEIEVKVDELSTGARAGVIVEISTRNAFAEWMLSINMGERRFRGRRFFALFPRRLTSMCQSETVLHQ